MGANLSDDGVGDVPKRELRRVVVFLTCMKETMRHDGPKVLTYDEKQGGYGRMRAFCDITKTLEDSFQYRSDSSTHLCLSSLKML